MCIVRPADGILHFRRLLQEISVSPVLYSKIHDKYELNPSNYQILKFLRPVKCPGDELPQSGFQAESDLIFSLSIAPVIDSSSCTGFKKQLELINLLVFRQFDRAC